VTVGYRTSDVVLLALRGCVTERLDDEDLYQYQYAPDWIFRDEQAFAAIKGDVTSTVIAHGGDPDRVEVYSFSSRYLLDVVRLYWRERHIEPIRRGMGAILALAPEAKEVDSAQGERHPQTGAS
jgi:hypothetical protein